MEKGIWIPKIKKVRFGLWNPVSGVSWNPEYSTGNPESHEGLESGIQVPLTNNSSHPGIRTVLDSFIWAPTVRDLYVS